MFLPYLSMIEDEDDKLTFEYIYQKYGDGIFRRTYNLLKNQQDAEDAMQETFLKVIQSINTYRKNGNARAWLLSITRNTAIDIMRKKNNSLCVEDTAFVSKESKDFAEKIAIEDALMTLDREDREIVVLKIVSGLKFREISQLTELPLTTVQKRYQRALKKLKTQLKD
jgi:RNA polymerase sigma-70 factor (ECF subfamily)